MTKTNSPLIFYSMSLYHLIVNVQLTFKLLNSFSSFSASVPQFLVFTAIYEKQTQEFAEEIANS